MRAVKELLIILKEEIEKDQSSNFILNGLCAYCSWIRFKPRVNLDNEEYKMLLKYIHNHRPIIFSKHYSWSNMGSPYFWPEKNMKSRLKWLESRINKLK